MGGADEYVEEHVQFPSGEDVLEGIFAYPEETMPTSAVLLLSPHPHLGGRMDNNVITYIARHLAADGCASLRFNYAGVGGSALVLSEGDSPYEYWARLEATQNYRVVLPGAIAAREFLQATVPGLPISYVGYSFGACLAVLLAQVHPPTWISLVAPPVSRAPLEAIETITMPCGFVAGDRDFAFDLAHFQPVLEGVSGEKSFVEIHDCDHFFRKREGEVYAAVRNVMTRTEAGAAR